VVIHLTDVKFVVAIKINVIATLNSLEIQLKKPL
jgi:hypothetical protein